MSGSSAFAWIVTGGVLGGFTVLACLLSAIKAVRDRRSIIARNMNKRKKRVDSKKKEDTGITSNGNNQTETRNDNTNIKRENSINKPAITINEDKRDYLDAKHEEIIGDMVKRREAFTKTISTEYQEKHVSNNKISVVENSLTDGSNGLSNNNANVGYIELQNTTRPNEVMHETITHELDKKPVYSNLDLNHKLEEHTKNVSKTEFSDQGYEGEQNLAFQTTPM